MNRQLETQESYHYHVNSFNNIFLTYHEGRQMEWQDRISINPQVCHGQPCISGTRVLVSVIIDNLAAGESHESIRHGYNIDDADIQAALHYAAELARDRFAILPIPGR